MKCWLCTENWRLAPVCPVWVSLYPVTPLINLLKASDQPEVVTLGGRLTEQSRAGLGVFQELAGPLVWPGIHFHKEDLGILLRHRNPPYIPYFIFDSLWLWQCVLFFHQVCLFFFFLLSVGEKPNLFCLYFTLQPLWAALKPASFILSVQPQTSQTLFLNINI